jgi:pyrroline-5-carboxylate reductase
MIGIIGCGNMAQAIVVGYANQKSEVDFLTYTPSYFRAEELAKLVNGKATKDLSDFEAAKTIVIACKPQQLNALVENIIKAKLDLRDKHIISILAATSIEVLKEKLKVYRVSRVMPNIPCLVRKGMSLIIHSLEVPVVDAKFVADFFTACGEVAIMSSEKLFDQVTTVSGSGPAYVFLFAQTMTEKLISWGINEDEARKITVQLFCGSSQLMLNQNEKSISELISSVTSKGGVTIEAIKSFERNNLSNLTSSALDAAFLRSEEIKKDLV